MRKNFLENIKILRGLVKKTFATLGCLALFSSCSQSIYGHRDISEDPEWAHLVSMKLSAEKDLLLFQWDDGEIQLKAFGSVGSLPKTVEEYNSLPLSKRITDSGKMLGVLKKGTPLLVTKVCERKVPMLGALPDLLAKILEGEFENTDVFLFFLMEGVRADEDYLPDRDYLTITYAPPRQPQASIRHKKEHPYRKKIQEIAEEFSREHDPDNT